jgi:hypothetical protein
LRRLLLLTALLLAAAAHAQAPAPREEPRTLELEGGGRINYLLRVHPDNAHVLPPGATLAPTSALDTAKLLNLHLSTGDIEEAALLSNSPRRRFEVLRDYRASVGDEEFKRVFAQYFFPENRLVAEIAIGLHRLLIWELKQVTSQAAARSTSSASPPPTHLAGQYFIEADGRFFIDDVPSDARTSLRWVLEAYRAGRLSR